MIRATTMKMAAKWEGLNRANEGLMALLKSEILYDPAACFTGLNDLRYAHESTRNLYSKCGHDPGSELRVTSYGFRVLSDQRSLTAEHAETAENEKRLK